MPTDTTDASGRTEMRADFRFRVVLKYAGYPGEQQWSHESEGSALARLAGIFARHPNATMEEHRTIGFDAPMSCDYFVTLHGDVSL